MTILSKSELKRVREWVGAGIDLNYYYSARALDTIDTLSTIVRAFWAYCDSPELGCGPLLEEATELLTDDVMDALELEVGDDTEQG